MGEKLRSQEESSSSNRDVAAFPDLKPDDPRYELKARLNVLTEIFGELFRRNAETGRSLPFPDIRPDDPNLRTKEQLNRIAKIFDELRREEGAGSSELPQEKSPETKVEIKL